MSCESIHSDKTQDMRTDILQQFLAGAHDLLVSTNVMGRGLDLVNVRQVRNSLFYGFGGSLEIVALYIKKCHYCYSRD